MADSITLDHFAFLLEIKAHAQKLYLLSATKQRKYHQLKEIGILHLLDGDYVILTDIGLNLVHMMGDRFQELTTLIRTL